MMLRSLLCALFLLALTAPAMAQWTLSPRPSLTIGNETDPYYQFNRIEHLRRLSDGRIVVTSGPDIRFFDATGKYVSSAGGPGRGPGEFQYVSDLLVMPGDSLMTMNIRTIIVLDPEGKFVRQARPDLSPLSTGDWFSEGMVLLPNGNLLAPQYSAREGSAKKTTLFRPVMRYSILDLSTARVTPVHTGGGIAQLYQNGRPWVMPFSPTEQQAVGADRVYVGDNDSTIIRSFDLTGKPLGVVTVADKPAPVTAADLDAYKQRQLEWVTQNGMTTQEFEQRWSAGPKPERHPYWGSALVDHTGVLWVSGPPRNGDTPVTWTTFNRNGRRIGTIAMPARFAPSDIGADYVLGVQRDEYGVETISMYSLRR